MNRMSLETGDHVEAGVRARRGTTFYVGVVLLVAGAGLLGYVGWQMFGSNVVSRQAQERIVGELRQQWASEGQGVERRSSLGDASAVVRIPAFGDDYEVPVLEGVGDDELASGYGHFPHSAKVGERGNYALAAHRVTHGEPLRDMPELRPGDEVIIETRDVTYTYELDTNPNELVVSFENIWVVDPLPTNPQRGGVQPPSQEPGQRLITLTTCSELFHTDNRMIAFGHLVEVAEE